MQKILQRPICHLTFQQANFIFDEIRQHQLFSHPQQPSVINRQQEISPMHHNGFPPQMQINTNNPTQDKRNSQQQQGMRMNRLNSLPENHQHFNSQQPQAPNFHNPMTPQHHQNVIPQENGQKIISKDSIIRKYDDVFGQKQNLQQLREQNSRLYYQKLALQASVQRLKQDNAKKDTEISRLKQIIQNGNIQNVGNANNNKNPQIQLPAQKPLHGFQSQVVNQPTSPQIHFRPNFQQKRPF